MSRPASETLPASGARWPVSWLISVVLPAPFGPMMACSSPLATSIETLSVARMPPNRRTSFSTRSSGSATGEPPQHAHDPTAAEQHDKQEQWSHDDRPIFGD